MKWTPKGRIFKIALWILAGFLILFFFRLLYGYTSKQSQRESQYISDFFGDENVKRNFASSSYKYNRKSQAKQSPKEYTLEAPAQDATVLSSDVTQKYEKTADLRTKSNKYDIHKKAVESHLKTTNGIVQFEQNSGQKGNREWHISVGVLPERFDSVYTFLSEIGNVRYAKIIKEDKTSEYKNLNAKKISLEKTRQSLVELKNMSGKVDEFVNLSNRILEIESELQGLGVQLGDFSEENEFCTIKFSLIEGRAIVPISLLHRLKVAFEWTIAYYLGLLSIIIFSLVVGLLVLVVVVDKMRGLSPVIKKLNKFSQ
jgi:hypothetical protein